MNVDLYSEACSELSQMYDMVLFDDMLFSCELLLFPIKAVFYSQKLDWIPNRHQSVAIK